MKTLKQLNEDIGYRARTEDQIIRIALLRLGALNFRVSKDELTTWLKGESVKAVEDKVLKLIGKKSFDIYSQNGKLRDKLLYTLGLKDDIYSDGVLLIDLPSTKTKVSTEPTE